MGDLWGPQIVSDVMMAVDAFAALPSSIRDLARLTIIGFGDAWGEFKHVIGTKYAHLGNLVLRERIDPADAPALLAGCDIGLLPLSDSPFNHCKSPTKMFEYMAMKVAVLGTWSARSSISSATARAACWPRISPATCGGWGR